jgi:biopolymer transport protein ExbB/TolQ
MKLGYKILFTILGSATAGLVVSKIYVAIELKKAKERYSQPDVEKQQLIDLVLASKNLDNNLNNQKLYANLDNEQLKEELNQKNINISYEYSAYE